MRVERVVEIRNMPDEIRNLDGLVALTYYILYIILLLTYNIYVQISIDKHAHTYAETCRFATRINESSVHMSHSVALSI